MPLYISLLLRLSGSQLGLIPQYLLLQFIYPLIVLPNTLGQFNRFCALNWIFGTKVLQLEFECLQLHTLLLQQIGPTIEFLLRRSELGADVL